MITFCHDFEESTRCAKLKSGCHCRRTRDVFSVAIKVHKEIQRRDISFGKSLGNLILRFLDRVRPQANIRGDRTSETSNGTLPRIRNGKGASRADESSKNGRPLHTISKPWTSSSVDQADSQYFIGVSRTTMRNRITDGLGRFRRRSLGQSLPVMALGLWWQPVRRYMEAELPRASPSWSSLSSRGHLQPFSSPMLLSPEFSGKQFGSAAGGPLREDIARLIYRPHGTPRARSFVEVLPMLGSYPTMQSPRPDLSMAAAGVLNS